MNLFAPDLLQKTLWWVGCFWGWCKRLQVVKETTQRAASANGSRTTGMPVNLFMHCA